MGLTGNVEEDLHQWISVLGCIRQGALSKQVFRVQILSTVWPEILAGRYFGGLLKICHLAEFTLAVESVLAIMIFIAKWLIERTGNLTLL